VSHRFYVVSSDGYRSPSKDVECPTDFDAMVHARQMLGFDGVIEVWQDARFVGVVGLSPNYWSNADRSIDPPSEDGQSLSTVG